MTKEEQLREQIVAILKDGNNWTGSDISSGNITITHYDKILPHKMADQILSIPEIKEALEKDKCSEPQTQKSQYALVNGNPIKPCPKCGGSGYIRITDMYTYGCNTECPVCNGTGKKEV